MADEGPNGPVKGLGLPGNLIYWLWQRELPGSCHGCTGGCTVL